MIGNLRGAYVAGNIGGERSLLVPESAATSIARAAEGLIPDRGTGARAKLALPNAADAPFTLANDGVAIAVRALGARPVPAQIEGGAVVYPGAYEHGTLAHVPLTDGTEELIEFEERPGERMLRWELSLRDGAAALRVVSGVVEVLDARGVPRLHVAAPTLVDRAGHVARGTIDVEGCAVDRDPRLPEGRPIVGPGAKTCRVVARFDDSGLSYPLLVDPAWTTTGSLANTRARHQAVAFKPSTGACSTGCVIVMGGHNSAVHASAEIYSEASGTWSSTGSMAVARHSFASVLYNNNKIVVAGGGTGVPTATTVTASVEQYDPATGAWSTVGNLPGGARMGLAGAYVTSQERLMSPLVGTTPVGQAIFSGGFNGTSYFSAVDIYLDTNLNDGTAPSLSAWRAMSVPRAYHAMAAWDAGCGVSFCTSRRVFTVAGGQTTGGTATSSVESVSGLYSPTPPTSWTAAGTLGEGRYGAGSVSWGAWFWIAGGWTGGSSRSAEVSFFNMSTGSLTAIGNLALARGDIAAAAANPTTINALFIGGSTVSTGADQGVGDVNAATTTSVSAVSPLTNRRTHHRAARLSNGKVLTMGGLTTASFGGTAYSATAEVFGALDNGQACGATGDCKSGHCVDGVCCDSACNSQCQACNLPSALGTCTAVTKTNGPTGYPAGQAVTGFGTTTRPLCTPFGEPCGFSCDGSSATACALKSPRPACITASCTAGVQTNPSTCDSLGFCPMPTPATVPCMEYACGSTACLSSCTVDANCATGYKCDTTTAKCIPSGDAGSPCTAPTQCKTGLGCVDGVCCTSLSCAAGMVCNTPKAPGQCKLLDGKTCTAPADCGSGFCVDGRCCGSICTGQCEACDVPGAEGTCSAVSGAPHGSRTACSDGGGDACKKLACDGSDRTKCLTYANGLDTVCQPATCSAGVLGAEGVCDGKGTCKVGESKSCAPFACDGTTKCKTTCASQSDCASGYNCSNGTCSAVTAKCSDDGASSIALDSSGVSKPCAPFACDTSTGNCFDKCRTTADCAATAVCDGATCIPAPNAGTNDDGGGCAVGSPTPGRIGGSALTILAIAAALGARRRRSV